MPQPLGPMIATISPPVDREVEAVEGHERLGSVRGGRTGRRGPSQADRPPAHGADHAPERAAGSARSPGRARRRRRTRRRSVGASSGRGSRRWSTRVIAPIAAGRSGCAPIPAAPSIAGPATAVSRTAGTATGNPVTSALIWFHVSLRAGPPQTRISSTRHAGREHRPGDVADRERRRLEDRPGEVAATVAERQPGERRRAPSGPRSASARRRGTAGRATPVGAGRRRGGLLESASVASSPARISSRIPVERPAGRGHRRADAEQAGQRRGRHEPARHLDRPSQ